MTVFLASSSPRRRELLARIVPRFECLAPLGVDEEAVTLEITRAWKQAGATSGFTPPLGSITALQLAVLKAESILRPGPPLVPALPDGACILGSDTVVALGDRAEEELLGKPVDEKHAVDMLTRLNGRVHVVWTGVAVAQRGEATRHGVTRTEVELRRLSPAEIRAQVATGDWRGKAGGYGIQSGGRGLVARIRGCFYNVVGLPLNLTAQLLLPGGPEPTVCDCSIHPLQDATAPFNKCLPVEPGAPPGRLKAPNRG